MSRRTSIASPGLVAFDAATRSDRLVNGGWVLRLGPRRHYHAIGGGLTAKREKAYVFASQRDAVREAAVRIATELVTRGRVIGFSTELAMTALILEDVPVKSVRRRLRAFKGAA